MAPRLLLFSPLPPARSGIADYVADLLPALNRWFEVILVRLRDQPQIREDLARRFLTLDWQEALEAEGIPLYQIGNNRLHEAVAEAAAERPGILVLHDLVLHHLLLDRTVGRGDFEAYRRILAANHGWIGDRVARPVRWGAFGQSGQFFLPAHRRLVELQRGILVHGPWAARFLREEVPGVPVRVVPMPVPLPPASSPEDAARFRIKHALPLDQPLLGSFGFQTPMKRTELVIRALARPELAKVHLLIAGEVSPYCKFQEVASQAGVEDRVHLLGYLPFEELERAIGAVDICFNLRYPSAGETSASLLRILALGKPVIASAYAELGEMVPELVRLIHPGPEELDELVLAVRQELSLPRETKELLSQKRRNLVRDHHDPERVVEQLARSILELEKLPPGKSCGEPEVPYATSAMRQRLRGLIAVEGLDRLQPGERGNLSIRVRNTGEETWLPSHEVPGGVLFETQLIVGQRDLQKGRPWLVLERPLLPGQERTFQLELRRPVAPARFIVRAAVARGDGHLPILEWSWEGSW